MRWLPLIAVSFVLVACPEDPRSARDQGGGDSSTAADAAGDRSGTATEGGSVDTARSDGRRDTLTQPDAKAPAGIVLRVTFDTTPLGAYSQSAIKADWPGLQWSSGLTEGRVHIISGADAQSGRSLRVLYPKGSVGPSQGGAQWLVKLPKSYTELYCSYWVRFGPAFGFVKGGKLPGLAGGTGNTGGDKPTGSDGWSARMMWRTAGAVVQYVYHPDQPTIYGEDMSYDIGGQRSFKPGTWHRVQHRIVMNTPGQKNGIVQGWFDGVLALDRKNIRFRDVSTFAIDLFYFSTFFGGSDSTWAATKDEYVYFDDFIIATQPVP